jgi:ABC-type Mn2+/Zn2+ transport system permease subunit
VEFITNPIEWWIDPFRESFMRDLLVVGLLLVVAMSLVGTWVVLRGMTFLGDALAHGVVPGIAIAFVIGANTTIGALLAAVAMVSGVSLIRAHSPLPEDTSIGVLFVGFLATGVVIVSSQSSNYAGDLTRFLFGSVTGVTNDDLVRQLIAAIIAVIGVVVFHRAFLVMTFDELQARLLGLRPRLAHAALLVLLAVTIVASFQTVGSLLVFAFLVAPPATAAMLVRSVPRVMIAAVLIGWVAVVIGLLISVHHETATGATMSLVAVVIFLLVLAAKAVTQAATVRSTG